MKQWFQLRVSRGPIIRTCSNEVKKHCQSWGWISEGVELLEFECLGAWDAVILPVFSLIVLSPDYWWLYIYIYIFTVYTFLYH